MLRTFVGSNILPIVEQLVEGKEITKESRFLLTSTLQRMALSELDNGYHVSKVKETLTPNARKSVQQQFASMFSACRSAVKTLKENHPEVLEAWRNGESYTVTKELMSGDCVEVPVTAWNYKTIFLSGADKHQMKLEALAKVFYKLSASQKEYVLNYDPNGSAIELAEWSKEFFNVSE
jgi:hypothetical protein